MGRERKRGLFLSLIELRGSLLEADPWRTSELAVRVWRIVLRNKDALRVNSLDVQLFCRATAVEKSEKS